MENPLVLKRLEMKYIRDKAKSSYPARDKFCYICLAEKNLQLHHYNSLTPLWNLWKNRNKVQIKDVDDIEYYRDIFIAEHQKELNEECVTLCKSCHMDKLHKVYGQSPNLGTASKQKAWVDTQRAKHALSRKA